MKIVVSTLLIGLVVLSSCSTANIKEPEYREVREVRLIELGVLQSKAGIDFVFYNPNNTGVQLTEARGDIYIDNVYFGRFELREKVQVKKRSEFIIPAIIKVDMIGAVMNQRDLWKKKEALIRVDGIARVKKSGFSKEVPIKYESMENIERFRSLVSK
jgi:LEA14-like dessication related protein